MKYLAEPIVRIGLDTWQAGAVTPLLDPGGMFPPPPAERLFDSQEEAEEALKVLVPQAIESEFERVQADENSPYTKWLMEEIR